MAACRSFPLCAPLGLLLLLLIGVISSHLPKVQAAPTDFWCNSKAREYMMEKIEGLKQYMLQQKHAEVVGALQMFQGGVKEATNQSTLQCQTTLLGKLEHRINNYLAIVNRLPIQNDTGTPAQSAVQACSSPTSLNKVLEMYRNLIIGKLERLAIDLQDSMCKKEHKTTNT